MKKKTPKQSLLERIDEIRANSVTDEEFKKVWGVSIDDHVDEMMKYISEQEEKYGRK